MKAKALGTVVAALALLVASGSPPARAQEAGGASLSLRDVLKTALENNFDVRVQQITRDSADLNLKASYGMYDPLLGVDWATSINRQPITSRLQVGVLQASTYMNRQDQYNLTLQQKTPWGQGFSLEWDNSRLRTNSSYSFFNPTYESSGILGTSLPLLRGFGKKVAAKTVLVAKVNRDIAGQQYLQNLRDTLLQVEKDYWNLVYAYQDLSAKQKALEIAKQFQEETRKKIQVGVLAPIEQVAADAQVATREQDIITSMQVLGDAQDILKLDMGLAKDGPEWGRTLTPSDQPSVSTTAFGEAELVAKAQDARPEIKILAGQVEKDVLDTHGAKNALLPKLDLNASLTYNGSAGRYVDPLTGLVYDQSFSNAWHQVSGLDFKSYYVGLTFSLPIGNRAAKYAYQATRLAQTADEIRLEKLRLSVQNEVRAAVRNMEAAQKRVAAAEVAFRLQQEKLDAEQKKYENGLSTSFQVLSYQNDLLAAATSLLNARIGSQVAGATLDRAVGNYLESRDIEIK